MSNRQTYDSDYHPDKSESDAESEESIEEEEALDEDDLEVIHEVQQDAQGWPDVSKIEPILTESESTESRKKAVRSLYNAFVASQGTGDIATSSKNELIKVVEVTKHSHTLPKQKPSKKLQGIVKKCMELCPEKKKRVSSNERKASTSGTSTPRTEGSVQGENNSATVVVGVDITDSTNANKPKSAESNRKRKSAAKFDVAETKKPKDNKDVDFFSSQVFNNFGIKGHPAIIPRRTDKTPVDKQVDDWNAIDKDTAIAVFEKTWINEKSTNKVFVLRILRRYKKKNSDEGAVYTFDIPLENLPIMMDQLQELKNDFEKKNPKWFDEAMEKRKALIREMQHKLPQPLEELESD